MTFEWMQFQSLKGFKLTFKQPIIWKGGKSFSICYKKQLRKSSANWFTSYFKYLLVTLQIIALRIQIQFLLNKTCGNQNTLKSKKTKNSKEKSLKILKIRVILKSIHISLKSTFQAMFQCCLLCPILLECLKNMLTFNFPGFEQLPRRCKRPGLVFYSFNKDSPFLPDHYNEDHPSYSFGGFIHSLGSTSENTTRSFSSVSCLCF